MEKYLADRSYALIYRMCQVQVFSSRLHAKGFPAIGKYEPKTPPKMAGVTKYVIGFGRYSGFARRFCRERPIRATQKPVARAFLAPGLRKAEPDSRTLRSLPGRISGSVARGCGTPPDGYGARRDFVSLPLFSLSFSGSIAGICKSPKRSACPDRKPSVADRSDAEPARNTGSCPAGRAAGLHPSRRLVDRQRRHPIPLGRIRQSYISLCGGHTRPGVAISPSRSLRLTDRVSDRFRPRGLCRRKEARTRKPEASETRKPVRQGI